ncbi:hypothetical protein LTR85_002842 [Meristemomyces frigidus]|nr:hypothetical protein LTR85_002842 [Meristemomyces frigidus]
MGAISEDAYSELVFEGICAILQVLLGSEWDQSDEQLGRLSGLPEALALASSQLHEGVSAAGPILASSFPTADQSLIANAFVELTDDIDNLHLIGDINGRAETSNSALNGSEVAETEDLEGFDGAPREPTEGLKGLLYYIAEEDARRKAYEHRGIHCEECGESPIRNTRFHCLNCPDFDLCMVCEAQSLHPKTHVFAKIKIPLPVLSQPIKQYPIWYPGDPRKMHTPLDSNVKKRLSREYGFEEPNIDALYDQFTCMANVPWAADPTKVKAAIDRRAFNKALTSERWPQRFAPNAIYDRMFAFYDEDSNGLIGFEEFISGLAYLRGPKRFASLRRAIQGFDINWNGFLDRQDFLRLFRAKYVIQQQLVNDMVEVHEAEQTMAAMDVLRSSQPISSIFNQEEIPRGEERPRRGKQLDIFGDMQPLPETKTILDDNDPWPRDANVRRPGRRDATSQDRLRHHLSRFEEMLYGPAGTDGPTPSPHDSGEARPQIAESGAAQRSPVLADHQPDGTDRDNLLADGDEISLHAGDLWDVVEAGFNEMLNPLFEAKELEQRDVISTKSERSTWRAEIQTALEEKRAFQQELQSAALVDPLMATAMKSYPAVKVQLKFDQTRQQRSQQAPEPAFRGDIVPTDAETLARREAEIAQRPLQDLLSATGYGTVDSQEPTNPAHPAASEAAIKGPDELPSSHAIANPRETTSDPMLPQNRPNASPPPLTGPLTPENSEPTSEAAAKQTPPSRERLVYLASLDDAEREMEGRGGAGRLSLDEVEGIVYTPTNAHGLIFSFHGRSRDGAEQAKLSQFSDHDFNPSMLAVYPNGIKEEWQGDPDAATNDVQFTLDMIEGLTSEYCIDLDRIFAAGKSNGGGFVANTLACDPTASTKIAAFAGVSGAYYQGTSDANCNASTVPITKIMDFFQKWTLSTTPITKISGSSSASASLTKTTSKSTAKSTTTKAITSTSISTSSAAASSSTSVTSPNCPMANGTTFTTDTGSYRVLCGFDTTPSYFRLIYNLGSWGECMAHCSDDSRCAHVVWNGVCYLKSGVQKYIKAGSGTRTAVKLS